MKDNSNETNFYQKYFRNTNMFKVFRNVFIILMLLLLMAAMIWSSKRAVVEVSLAGKPEVTETEFVKGKRGKDADEEAKKEEDEGDKIDVLESKKKNYPMDSPSLKGDKALMVQLENLKLQLNNLQKQGTKVFPEVNFLSYKDRKRILVTGGAGFVGSHLVDKLMLMGHEVTVVDNFFTGRKRNVEQWIGHQNFELLNHDVINGVMIEVDRIYHLASPASPPHYMYNPIKTIKTNTIGTINMLGLAKRVRARLLFASTSEVYGDPEVHPQSESYWGHVNPIGPRACYDEAKRVGETLCYAYHKQEGVDVRVARIFNTFGPRMHMNDGRVVSNFILQALQDQPMTVYGSGNQTRSFQYVTDLVDGLVTLMESNYSQPVNIGNPEEHTIMEFAKIIKKLLAGKGKIVNKDPVVDDPRRRKPDITIAASQLGWKPKVALMAGINKTIEYFKNELKRKKHSERNLWKPEYL